LGAPSSVYVLDEMAATRPSRWSSWPSSTDVFPGRSCPKNMATKMVSSVSSMSASLVTAMARGAVPTEVRSTVAMIA
jgi:hypothetical protein